jgi:hypothetical protein
MNSLGESKNIYILENNKFKINLDTIKAGQGFMLYSKNNGKSNELKGEYYDFKEIIKTGWNFLGASKEYKISTLNSILSSDTIFVLRNEIYIKQPLSIKAGEGFLLYR